MRHSSIPYSVFKDRDHSSSGAAKKSKNEPEEAPPPAYIPVVGEDEPELKPTGTTEGHKRKLDQSQLATDDYHYDKYKKRTRHY